MNGIRPEGPGDAAGIRRILEAAFDTGAEALLVDRLRAAGRALVSLVAVDAEAAEEEEIVGHVLFSPVRVEPGDAVGVGLAPLAVLPARQGQGIGSRLVREGLAACRRAGIRFAVVLGDPAYYGRFGFAPASAAGVANEYGAGDAFMLLELRPGGLPGPGIARYAPEFADLGE